MNEKTLLTLEETLSACNGIFVMGEGDFYFSNVETDSRNVTEGTFFVPLIGEFQDGHKYIPQAVEKGASCIFIARSFYENDKDGFVKSCWQKKPDVKYIVVENTMTALQNIAEKYVSKFPNLIKVAVTGSSGKTTCKEMILSILSQKYDVVCNKGNFNSETGLPLSVFNIRENHQVGLFEMGMNRKNEIAEISKVLKAKYALITNIGTAHIGILGSRENIAEEKSNVFNYLDGDGILVDGSRDGGTAFIPCGDDYREFLINKASAHTKTVVFYGSDDESYISNLKYKGLKGTSFEIDGISARLSLPGVYNFYNILGAIEVGKALGLSSQQIADGVNGLKPMFGRSQILDGKYAVVQDCYNANPDSMEKAIEFVSSVKNEGDAKKVFVLGDMLELGAESKNEHEKLGKLCAESSADILIFAGKETEYSFEVVKAAEFKGMAFFFEGRSDETVNKIAECIKENASEGSTVLIKGSRGMALERVTEIIQKN